MTKSLDGCLGIYTAEDFQAYANELRRRSGGAPSSAPRCGRSWRAPPRSPPTARAASPSRRRCGPTPVCSEAVVVTGFLDHIEVWDAEKWPEVESAGSSSLAAAGAGLEDLV